MAARTSSTFYEGQRGLIECEFRLAGVLTDPTVVTAYIKPPSGGQTALNYPSDDLTRSEEGIFNAAVLFDEGGTWWIRFTGVGVVDAVNEISVIVESSNFVLE